MTFIRSGPVLQNRHSLCERGTLGFLYRPVSIARGRHPHLNIVMSLLEFLEMDSLMHVGLCKWFYNYTIHQTMDNTYVYYIIHDQTTITRVRNDKRVAYVNDPRLS